MEDRDNPSHSINQTLKDAGNQRLSQEKEKNWKNLVQPFVGVYLFCAGAVYFWWAITHIATHGPVTIISLILAVVLVWIAVKVCILAFIQFLLEKQWKANQFSLVVAISSRAVSLLERSPLMSGFELANLEINFANASMLRGSSEIAETLLRKAKGRILKSISHARTDQLNSHILCCSAITYYLGVSQCCQGKYADAIAEAELALRQFNDVLSKEFPVYRAMLLLIIAEASLRLDDMLMAEESLIECNRLCEMDRSSTGEQKAWALVLKKQSKLASALINIKKDQFEESFLALVSFLSEVDQDAARLGPLSANGLCLIAEEYINHNNLAEAEEALNTAYIACKIRPFSPDSVQVLNCFEKLLVLTGRPAEVTDMRALLRECRQSHPLIGN